MKEGGLQDVANSDLDGLLVLSLIFLLVHEEELGAVWHLIPLSHLVKEHLWRGEGLKGDHEGGRKV